MDKKIELPKPFQRGGDLMLSFIRRFAVIVAIAGVSVSLPSYSWAQDDAKPAHAESDHDHADGDHDHEQGGGDHDGHADAAHADAGHADGHTPPLLSFDAGSAFCNLAIFLGVFFILSKFVWPVILGGLKAREEKIHGDLEAAENATAEAKGLLAEYQTKLDDAASQVQAMLAEARRDAEASGQRIVEEAKAEAQRQSERAIADIETAKKVAISDIAGQTSDMAISVAKQVVGRELKADDHAELIRQSLERLPSNN